MLDSLISKMATDLGIKQYYGESDQEYECRTIYSSLAGWIKTITLDQPVGSKEAGLVGVSRRHLYERSRSVFDTYCKMFPEIIEWFDSSEEHPVAIIRSRLIRRGDLQNAGFNTNIALVKSYSEHIAENIEAVFGKTLDENISYSGIGTIRYHQAVDHEELTVSDDDWAKEFLKDAWWSSSIPDRSNWEYFNPLSQSKNNYSSWQGRSPEAVEGIVLCRAVVNKYGYEYYLLKNKGTLVHKLDPFLQDLGYHIRFMLWIRACAGNTMPANVELYKDHVKLKLNFYLPERENILLESYCWPSRHINDKLEWNMPVPIWNYIKPQLRALEIDIEESENG